MATVELALERWFSDEFRAGHPEILKQIRAEFARHTDDGYLKAYYLFAHAESEMRQYPVSDVSCPALVITGSEDVGSTPAMSSALSGDFPDSRLIINPGYRHMAPVEHAAGIAGQLNSFLTTPDLNKSE
jgi:pimeloyl-ACP methyl ester carboxylesterase